RGLIVRPFRAIDVTFHAPVPVPAPAEAEAREAWMATVRERIASGLTAEPRPAALPVPAAPVSAATPGG
ncbi:MAG: hypothetical protein GYA57_12420, partial [Myxococcales bacterium]|nr:hypothetical protein [Myxococcales bacterium]